MSHIAYTYKKSSSTRKLLGILVMTFLCPAFAVSFALAQGTTIIAPTTGVGDLGTTMIADGKTVQITGGTRPGNGENLFHSFEQFNVGTGDTAQFLNNTPSLHTSNILGRVTGGNPSSIFGTIDTMSYPNANFFLMNPAGIVFGPNATLNVTGSVAFTTANYLRLAEANGSNAGIFHADTAATSLLTSASVAAFGFLGPNPAAIAIQGSTLELRQPDQSISLVGGNQGFSSINVSVPDGVTMTGGHLSASSGHINIGSVASPGEILAGTLDQAQNINGQSFGALGAIQLSQSGINTSGGGGEAILIRGGSLVVDASEVSASTGDISFDATSIQISNVALIATVTETASNAGHIILKASRDITLESAAVVGSFSQGSSGHAGNITFSSTQGDVGLADSSLVTSQADNKGNTGHVKIDAPHGDILLDGAHVFTSAQGTGTLGGILIEANNLFMRNEASIVGNNFTTQVAENIAITLEGRLDLTGNSVIETGTPGSANAADLIISSRDILITEKSMLVTGTTSSGDAGRLSIFTDNLQLTDGGRLSSRSLVAPGTVEIPTGRGGFISIEGFQNPGPSVTIDGPGSGIFTSTEGTDAGGTINLSARSLTMTDRATITASSTGTVPNPGKAGDISINAGQSLEMRDSSITTEAVRAGGGNIKILAIDRVRLVNSPISTSVHSGPGSGGNITIDPNIVVLQNSPVTAQADRGAGGNIIITTPLFLADSTSPVNASSQKGINGTVTIQSPTSNLSESLGTLPSNPSQAQSLLTQRCAALVNGQASSFVVAGREQLPADPGGWLSSPLAFAALSENLDAGLVVAAAPATMPIAGHDTGTVSLRRLTPAVFLMANFAESEATGCRS
jgi:filamentous hemagglutinin family protein